MSSRFFRAISDSESESSEEEELLSDEETQTRAKAQGSSDDSDDDSDEDSDEDDSDEDDSDDGEAQGPRKPMSRFMRDASSDSESEDDAPKVIRSAKDKRLDEFDAVAHSIENAQRIDDWASITKDFDALLRLCDRQKNLGEQIPITFIKTLVGLENALTEAIIRDKSSKKKMKAPNARAMNGMKQKLKKTVKENDEAVSLYRDDPAAYEAKVAAANAAPTPALPITASKKATNIANVVAAAEAQADDDEGFQTVGQKKGPAQMPADMLFKSLAAVLEARGRKSTDRTEQTETLMKLLDAAQTPYQKIRVLLVLLAARFDYSTSVSAYMPSDLWEQARSDLNTLLDVLSDNVEYVVVEETEEYDDQVERRPNTNGEGAIVPIRGSVISFIDRLDDEFTRSLQHMDPHATEYVERLGDEKRLYQTIVRAQSYFESVLDQELSEPMRKLTVEPLSRCAMRRLEHIYPKQDVIIVALEKVNHEAQPNLKPSKITPSFAEVSDLPGGPSRLVNALCVYLYACPGLSGERLRTRAMLFQIYHHALHADYYVARDRFLMSHLQESIHLADVATQILFNRVVVQLGLCAFRVGLVRECQSALQEIYATGRVKELLAQGVSKPGQYNVSPEAEKLDRQRQVPFHMHINLELLECVYLVASMLLEIPNMAYAGSDPELRKRVISRPFRRMLDYTDRQVFTGPPENTRDHIMQASKALQNGDWKACISLIESIKIWKLIPDKDRVISMLAHRIQEEGLRTYLFSFAAHYDSLSLAHLATTFELEEDAVRSIVSRMIFNDELAASLDSEHNVIVFQRIEHTKLQQLAIALSERANSLLEQNEWMLDSKLGDERSGDSQRREARRKGRSGRRAPLQSHTLSQKA
ncbi:Translation initiation factor 3 subunit c [Malassezia cuniculi]|uniref:Eukaryotic translation initiation factor 3 subunit C n=1 Tax=Malassezia cuniculi TaxID=948313 RepID=A0AAF0J860_9BASI|nr:Translation initiation factor 3 subunit c [Malassezia cuniculi]